MIEMSERQKIARVIVPWHLSGWVLDSRDVQIIDFSVAGVRIEHVEPLLLGASCTLELPPSFGPLRVTARVVWSMIIGGEQTAEGKRRLHHQSGLAFIGITGDQQASLAGVVEKLNTVGSTEDTKPRP